MSFLMGTLLLAVVTAVACAIPGVFVVLRRSSMLVDGMGHAVLPGIVVGYYFTHDLRSPLLIVGATLAGVFVVLGSEYLARLGVLTGDAPQGLIFPALFSAGVIMITLNFANVHLDTHAVLVGDLNLISFDQLTINGTSYGPRYMYVMLGVLAVNLSFIAVCYHRLKITTFDNEFATLLGMRSGVLNGMFMFLVSLTVTAAFHAVGAILVISLIVVPAATAYLLTCRLGIMVVLAGVIAGGGAVCGFWVAYWTGAATSAGMAVFYGCVFILVFLGVQVRQRFVRARAYRQASR
ncbi:metal ABC transporter permease [Trueperella sp. LYQ141]|uniref:metal ABC transporter permease n=1 Tax=Trueperella sp. LYQ141 TaxID=3391058 RepID=UPI0039834477